MRMQPQYRICFSVEKVCKRCRGEGVVDYGEGEEARCPSCLGKNSKVMSVQVLSIRKEYELQQKAMAKAHRRRAI